MQPQSTTAEPQRLFPSKVEDKLVGWLGRTVGVALALAMAGLWASLLSWSLNDPSLTHATGGRVSNTLGAPGAIVSDLLLQTLGLATLLLLLAPMMWAIDLLRSDRVDQLRTKVTFFPLSILALAGAASTLPAVANWPLHHGYGGIVGDALYGLTAVLFGVINPERAHLATGFVLLASGLVALARSLGIQAADIQKSLAQARSKVEATTAETAATPAQPVMPAPPAAPSRPPYPPYGTKPAASDAPANSTRKEPSFDVFDAASRAIAERFAPTGVIPAADPTAALHRPVETGEAHAGAQPQPGPATAQTQAPGKGFLRGFQFRQTQPEHKRPSLNILARPQATRPSADHAQTVLRGNARLLEDVLSDFGVKAEVREVRPGPVVTLYEVEPARGTKSSRVIGLADDIARSLSATAVRIAAIPGRNVIGIELPNAKRDPVLLRDVLESEAYRSCDATLPLTLGKSIGGQPVVTDLARMPHLLVAGTTGSGKSVGVNAMILSLLYKLPPSECRLILIDPKMLELSVYNGIPHLLTPVVTDPQRAVAALNWVVAEMEERYKRMAKLAVRSIDVYNNRVRNAKKRGDLLSRTVQTGFDRRTGQAIFEQESMDLETMPYIVVVVDEFADLMMVAGKEIEAAVQRLAQMARAAGIHLIMATQRPSVDIITGTIKANFPTRISFKVTSRIDSRTILNEQGAEQLLGAGDMLFSTGSGQIVRVHGAFVADEEVEAVAQFLRAQGEPEYVAGITDVAYPEDTASPEATHATTEEELFEKAVAVVVRDRKASTSYIQRRLQIGYNRAADLIERMERERIVGPAGPTGKREILVGTPAPSADAA